MSPWMSNTASKPYNLQRPTPATTWTISVSTCVPAIPVIKQARVNHNGQQHNDVWDISARDNELFPVSVNIYTRGQGHIAITQCFVKT